MVALGSDNTVAVSVLAFADGCSTRNGANLWSDPRTSFAAGDCADNALCLALASRLCNVERSHLSAPKRTILSGSLRIVHTEIGKVLSKGFDSRC